MRNETVFPDSLSLSVNLIPEIFTETLEPKIEGFLKLVNVILFAAISRETSSASVPSTVTVVASVIPIVPVSSIDLIPEPVSLTIKETELLVLQSYITAQQMPFLLPLMQEFRLPLNQDMHSTKFQRH